MILVFDLTERESLEFISRNAAQLKETFQECPVLLIGNKSDLEDQLAVSEEEVKQVETALSTRCF